MSALGTTFTATLPDARRGGRSGSRQRAGTPSLAHPIASRPEGKWIATSCIEPWPLVDQERPKGEPEDAFGFGHRGCFRVVEQAVRTIAAHLDEEGDQMRLAWRIVESVPALDPGFLAIPAWTARFVELLTDEGRGPVLGLPLALTIAGAYRGAIAQRCSTGPRPPCDGGDAQAIQMSW